MNILSRHTKKDLDRQKMEYLLEAVLALQKSNARLRQDLRQITHEEIIAVLDQRARRYPY